MKTVGSLLQELKESERSEDAIPILQKTITTLRPLETELPSLTFAALLDRLGRCYYAVGQWREAFVALTEALERKRGELGLHHALTIDAMNTVCLPLMQLGEFNQVYTLLSEGLDAAKAIKADPELRVLTMANLGAALHGMSRYDAALKMLQAAEKLARETMDPHGPNYGKVLQGLGNCHQSVGNLGESLGAFEQAFPLLSAQLGKDHPETLETQIQMGNLFMAMGEYPRAQRLLQEVLATQVELYGEESDKLAPILSMLGHLCKKLGEYDYALAYYDRALTLGRRLWGENHIQYAQVLDSKADLFSTTRHVGEAEPLYLRCLDIFAVTPGVESEEYASTLSGLANVYNFSGRFDEAEKRFQQASAIQRRVLGPKHSTLAYTLHSLGRLYYILGRYQEAEEQFNLSIEAEPNRMGLDDMDRATTLVDLALVHAAANHPEAALRLLQDVEVIHDRLIAQISTMGSEEQRMAFLSTIEWRRDVFLSLVWRYFAESPDCVRQAFELVLRRKALGTRVTLLQRAALASQKDQVAARLWQALVERSRSISHLRMQGAAPGEERQHQDAVEKATADRRWLEQQIAQCVTPDEILKVVSQVDTDTIREALPKGAGLLEVVRVIEYPFDIVGRPDKLEARYLAFVLRTDELHLVDLGQADTIEARIEDARNWLTDRETRHKQAEDGTPLWVNAWYLPRLRMSLYDPLAPLLGGIQHLIVAPDGTLTQIPLEIIPLDSDEWFVDRFTVYYVQCGRDLAERPKYNASDTSAPMVLACPTFLLDGSAYPTGSTREELAQALERAGICFSPLPCSRQEGERVAALLGVVPFLDHQAVKGVLKSARSPRILHLATHGFFLAGTSPSPDLLSWHGPAWQRLSRADLVDPMLRSGLAFSGAQTWLEGGELPPEAENGILTAEEVTTLDLRGTELVVLSACNTGTGEIRSGEGVYGLRRAFLIAGARTVIMSLWSVSDESTQLLMTEFYQQMLVNGLPHYEALRKAQQVTREHVTASGHQPYKHPYYWGAFICEGDAEGRKSVERTGNTPRRPSIASAPGVGNPNGA